MSTGLAQHRRKFFLNPTSKILWGEGLFLRPQHFQQQDSYHEARLAQTSQALHPYAWGVRSLKIDAEGLKNNSLRFEHLSVIFPDGEIYDAPNRDKLPAPVSLADIGLGQNTLIYHVALPILNRHGGNAATEANPKVGARYASFNEEAQDLFTQAASASITCLDKQARLIPAPQAKDSFVSLPVVQLQRDAKGGFTWDETYLTPGVTLAGCGNLLTRLRRLMDALSSKAQVLQSMHREPSQNIMEFRPGDVASFWLLHTLNSAYAVLSHLHNNPAFHPERYFEQLLALAGQLMTFSKTHTLAHLPAYVHASPSAPFERLHHIVAELTQTVISSRHFIIDLRETKPGYLAGRLDLDKINEKTELYLAVSAEMPALELVEIVPRRFKMGSPDDVAICVRGALPGVALTHLSQVPSVLPVKPDTHYFAVETKGTLYERMLHAQSISIYTPPGIQKLHLELMALSA
jgi:type VI secretion system protein ImpJ